MAVSWSACRALFWGFQGPAKLQGVSARRRYLCHWILLEILA
jgi:hypothetical protein